MAKRLGHPMNEMKKKKRSELDIDTENDIRFKKRSEIKKKSEDDSEERKKRMESVLNVEKRIGRPMNEMKRKKKNRVSDRVSAADISRLEAELDRALDILDEVQAADGQEGSIRRRRRKRIVPVDEAQAEEIEQDLVKNIKNKI